MNYSKRSIGQYNRTRVYHHSGVSETLLATTVAIASDEQVVTFASQPDTWYVASKVNQYHVGEQGWTPRYYKMILIEGRWHCSSQDERTQAYCKAAVEVYRGLRAIEAKAGLYAECGIAYDVEGAKADFLAAHAA